MCSVMGALAMVGNGVAALGSYAASEAQSQAQYDAQVEQNNIALMQNQYENRQKADQAVFNYEQLANKEIEINEKAAHEKGEIAREADKRRSEQRVASSWNGTASATIQRLMGDIHASEARDTATVDSNRDANIRNVMADREATRMRSEPTPLYLASPSSSSGSGFSALTGVVSGGLNALGSYIRNKPVTTAT